ncbi:ATP-binding protein [Streptomyces beigongshangae]|uniref:ATP-binding protein n=1 Tax=Streptomyces beigongshangae TaxID=2841597 RepID=UPI001C85E4B4|nr:ATP-binding protein [Streptomyces sp. REN17]
MPHNAIEPWEYTLSIPNDPRAVTVCRRTLRPILTVHGLIGLTDVAELLAAELVSNAVCHTKGPAALRLRWRDEILRIGAWDGDPEPPRPAPSVSDLAGAGAGAGAGAETESGRGLALVQACADVWGWHPLSKDGGRSKYVWCDLGVA